MNAVTTESTVIYWFRNDLRLHDNAALAQACRGTTHLVPVFCHPPADEVTPWGFARVGPHRQVFLADTLRDLAALLKARGSQLLECTGAPEQVLPAMAQAVGATTVVCEAIAAPYEQAQVTALRASGLTVRAGWQSTLLSPVGLPFATSALPDVFTAFRSAVERAKVQPPRPLATPAQLPPLSPNALEAAAHWAPPPAQPTAPADASDAARSSFPYATPAFAGGETAALAHVRQYMDRKLPHTYKQTRNGLTGLDYSSKFSPWLATGALSARQVFAQLQQFEQEHGANDGSYWLWFELLWRDYFRFLHLKYGRDLYRARGLSDQPAPVHNRQGFDRWCQGNTGEPLVDAAMRELAATGYMSNRLRQLVASYLVHDLHSDWRAGAAWFESQLVDYDVYSNQGNWLYGAGRGTDPRGGRRFNPQKQTQDHDANGSYRRLWGTL